MQVADLPAAPLSVACAGTWERVVLHPCSSPGLSDELRGKKRIEAARVREVDGEEPQVHVACELTADSSGKRRRQLGSRLQTWS